MSSVSSMANKFGGTKGGSSRNVCSAKDVSVADQFAKEKLSSSPEKSAITDGGESKVLVSPSGKSIKLSVSTIDLSKSEAPDPEESIHEDTLHCDGSIVSKQEETTIDKLSKSAPMLGAAAATDTAEKKPRDPSGSVTPGTKKKVKVTSSTSSRTPKTVRKTAIKASDLGIDLTDISSESLSEAVKKWKAEQAGKRKPDPAGSKKRIVQRFQSEAPTEERPKSRGRSSAVQRSKSSRSKSRGRAGDASPTKSGTARVRSKSRPKSLKGTDAVATDGASAGATKSPQSTPKPLKKKVVSAGETGAPASTGKIKRKIIVRRRASLEMPPNTEGGLERAPPARRESKDDMADLLKLNDPIPEPLVEPDAQSTKETKSEKEEESKSSERAPVDPQDSMSPPPEETPTSSELVSVVQSASPKSPSKDSPEACVEAILEQVPLSPKRLVSKTTTTAEVSGSPKVLQKRSASRGRLAKARSDAMEIQKRLKAAGITDDQYKAMLSAGLSIGLA